MDVRHMKINRAIASYYVRKIGGRLKTSEKLRKIVNDYSPEKQESCESLYDLISLCEALTGENKQKGAYFTPPFISAYIAKTVTKAGDVKIIDPSCGCGAILIACLKRLLSLGVNPVKAVSENLYGIDADEFHVYVCELLLELACLELGYNTDQIRFQISCEDSLRSDWFGKTFDYILGNPPYVDIHGIGDAEKERYKKEFQTAKGLFNLSYLFFEKSIRYLSNDGILKFLTINSILHSKSAREIRAMIDKRELLEEIIDLSEHKIFDASVKTCIVVLSRKPHKGHCHVKLRAEEAPITYLETKPRIPCLDWVGTTEEQQRIVKHIERFPLKLGSYLCGGVATLSDELFMVDDSCRKNVGEESFFIEPEALVPCIRASKKAETRIIYPYRADTKPYTEEELAETFPETYCYLLSVKEKLLRRDSGKENPDGWFAYGRRQALELSPKCLVIGGYNREPSFYTPNKKENALLMGGLGIKDGIPVETDILMIVLNSRIMQSYVEVKSYALTGGYWLYNRNVLKNFSIPAFTETEKEKLRTLHRKEADEFLKEKYFGKTEV